MVGSARHSESYVSQSFLYPKNHEIREARGPFFLFKLILLRPLEVDFSQRHTFPFLETYIQFFPTIAKWVRRYYGQQVASFLSCLRLFLDPDSSTLFLLFCFLVKYLNLVSCSLSHTHTHIHTRTGVLKGDVHITKRDPWPLTFPSNILGTGIGFG